MSFEDNENIKTIWLIRIESYINSHIHIQIQLQLQLQKYHYHIFSSIFDIIHDYIKDLHVFTTNSVVRALTHIINMSDIIETFLNMYDLLTLQCCVSEYIDIISNQKVSKISNYELISIYDELSQKNISLRQLFNLNYGMMDVIYVFNAVNIFLSAKLFITGAIYSKLDHNQDIDLVNDIFRPIESINDELPMCIIMPSYNNIKTVNATFVSLLIQNYTNYRVIFIDDISDDPAEISTILNIIDYHQQNSRYLIIKQYVKQRQCAGRYIGYHMAYDDEIIMFLDGDDMFYDKNTIKIINNAYNDPFVAVTYGSHVDLYHGNILNNCKGGEDFPENIINQKLYRYYKFISAHLRTGYAFLFKNIDVIDLLYDDKKFYHIMTDYAEMIPVLEMITPAKYHKHDICKNRYLPYLKTIKDPVYIYNMDNSLSYNTSFARRDEKDNDYYRIYRNNATNRIRSLTRYDFSIKNNKHSKIRFYLSSLMKNYKLDLLIININVDNIDDVDVVDNIDNNNEIIKRFHTDECIYLSGVILNNNLNHTIQLNNDMNIVIEQTCLRIIFVSHKQLVSDYNNLLQNYCLIQSNNINNINDMTDELNNNIYVIAYLSF